MSLTKAQARTLVQQYIDDPQAIRWSTTNLDLLISITLDSEWSNLLDFAPWATSQLDTLTSLTTPGYVDLRQSPAGSLSQRLHRIQEVTRNGRRIVEGLWPVIETNEVKASDHARWWARKGDELWIFPLDTDDQVEVRYSYKPLSFNNLTEAEILSWPDGHEDVVLFAAAARALAKGDVEDPTRFFAMAQVARLQMQSEVSRTSPGPVVPHAYDSALDFGGD